MNWYLVIRRGTNPTEDPEKLRAMWIGCGTNTNAARCSFPGQVRTSRWAFS